MLLIRFEQLCATDKRYYHYASTQHICEFCFSSNCMKRVARHGTALNAQEPHLFEAHQAIAQRLWPARPTALPAFYIPFHEKTTLSIQESLAQSN